MMRSIKSSGELTREKDITESTRQLWPGSMHRCADIHNAMGELTGAYCNTSEQNVDLSCSRIMRDNNDLQTLTDCFDVHDPVYKDEPCLKSLSTELIGAGAINFDKAKEISQKIEETLDGVKMEEASIKHKDKVRNFKDLMPTTNIDDKDVHIDPAILFSCLIALANLKENILDNFSQELTPEATSLFKHGLIQKPNKATLRKHFATKEKAIVLIEFNVCIVDDGA